MWRKARFLVYSTFSYRNVGDGDTTVTTSPFPHYSVIKLGIVASAIREGGTVLGKKVFEFLKYVPIRIGIPEKYSINTVTKIRYKWKKEKDKMSLDKTIGFREYVRCDYIDIFFYIKTEEMKNLFEKILKSVRYFGTGDSLVTLISFTNEEPKHVVKHMPEIDYNELSTGKYKLITLFDIDEKTTFEELEKAHKNELKIDYPKVHCAYNVKEVKSVDRIKFFKRVD